MEPMHQRVAGIDVHRMKHVVTILIGREDGAVSSETREFGGFKRDMRALVAWLQTHRIQQVVMESTGIYWKSVFGHLEAAGIPALVVNAFHVKNVPGRKTDVGDSEWLAQLARFGLLRGSFIPPKDLRELRIVSRYRRKLTGMLAGEKNRLHKLLDDAGIKLGGVVADIDGVCASKMVEGLIAGGKPGELAALGRGKVRATTDILEAAMDGELSARHRLVLDMAYDHLRYLEGKLAALDRCLLAAMQPYAWAWRLLQTIPGIDAVSAAMILIEIGDDPHRLDPRRAWRPGAPCVPATTSRPASVRAVRPATAIPSFVIFCARPPTPQGEPRPSSAPSTRAWSFAAATRKRSSPSPTNWCGPSTSSLSGGSPFATRLSITKLRASPRTPHAGSEPSRNMGIGHRSPLQTRRSRRPQTDPSCTPQIGTWGPSIHGPSPPR